MYFCLESEYRVWNQRFDADGNETEPIRRVRSRMYFDGSESVADFFGEDSLYARLAWIIQSSGSCEPRTLTSETVYETIVVKAQNTVFSNQAPFDGWNGETDPLTKIG